MLTIKHLLLLMIVCFSLPMFAQQKMTKQKFLADSTQIMKPKLVRPQFRLDNRLTFFNGQKLGISGLDAGVLLKEKLRVTLGYYQVVDKLTSLKKSLNDVEYQGRYQLNYGSLNTEFIYKNTRFFSLGMPLEFGFGSNSIKYVSDQDSNQIGKKTGFIMMTYFGLSGTFKPIRWIGLKVAIGYRKTLINKVKDVPFDGVYSSVGLAVDLREIIKDYQMFKLKKKFHKNANSVETAVDLITN